MKLEFRCLATGIGSLPHQDPKAACAFISKYFKEIPFWPQLPQLSAKEDMFIQYIEGFPGVSLDGEKTVWRRTDKFAEELEKLYEHHLQGQYQSYGFGKGYASGFQSFLDSGIVPERAVKGQVTGPVSMGLSLVKEDMRPALYDEELSDAIARFLCLKAIRQENSLKAICRETIMFVDEPSLANLGSAYINISKEQVVKLLGLVFKGISGIKAIHCCANTDWGAVIEAGPDIVSFDAYNYMVNLSLYASEVKALIERGGAIAWGIVPNTVEALQKETSASLKDRLEEGIGLFDRKGLNHRQLIAQSLLTPSCGMAGLPVDGAEKAAELLRELSALLRKRYG